MSFLSGGNERIPQMLSFHPEFPHQELDNLGIQTGSVVPQALCSLAMVS